MITLPAQQRLRSGPVVSVAGGYWTGSSAVLALLLEHGACRTVEDEFSLLSYGQLLAEATGSGSDRALERSLFRLREFNRPERLYPLRPILRRACAFLGARPLPLMAIRAGMGRRLGSAYAAECVTFEKFVRQARGDARTLGSAFDRLLEGIAAGAGPGDGPVLLDQFIAPAYAETAAALSERLKFVFVDRDWRDQYVEVRNILPGMMATNRRLGVCPAGEEPADYTRNRLDFFLGVRARIDAARARQVETMSDRVLWLDFESAVTATRAVAERVFTFLGLDPDDWRPGTVLVPERSQRNVGKWRHSPYRAEVEALTSRLPQPRTCPSPI